MKIIVFLLLILQPLLGAAQFEPLELASQVLSESGVVDSAHFYADELDLNPGGLHALVLATSEANYDYKPIRPDFTELIASHEFRFKAFEIDSNFQIINVTAYDSMAVGFDFYLYFKKNAGFWQLSDVQRLKRDVAVHLYFIDLYTEDQVDSIISSDNPYKIIRSKVDYNYMKAIHDLALNFDDSIVDYFLRNENKFNALKNSFYTLKTEGKRVTQDYLLSNGFTLSEVSNRFRGLNGNLSFIICSSSYSAVGYFYSPNKIDLPSMYSKNIFYTREIGQGWYLFKGRVR